MFPRIQPCFMSAVFWHGFLAEIPRKYDLGDHQSRLRSPPRSMVCSAGWCSLRQGPPDHSRCHDAVHPGWRSQCWFFREFCTTQLWQGSNLGVPQQLGWPTQKTKNTILPHFLINFGCLQFHKLDINLDQLNPAAEREVIQPTHSKSLLSLLQGSRRDCSWYTSSTKLCSNASSLHFQFALPIGVSLVIYNLRTIHCF